MTSVLHSAWILAGPTAVGKTATALELAESLNAEIISLDSMAVYRGMDIGTAKPTAAEQARVPHHLLDVVEPHEEYSLAEYLRAAEMCCREIVARGRVPLFSGGTGLYIRGLLFGLFDGPPGDQELRQRIEADAADKPPGWLHKRLQEVDATSASRLHPNDARRLVRALEVYELTGKPLSAWQQQSLLPASERPRKVCWLSPPREWLYRRINQRVEQMMARGLVEEVRELLSRRQSPGRTARQALGYREIIDHLAGRCSEAEAVETICTRTRQFAKRQHTWFRNLPGCQPVQIDGTEDTRTIARRVMQAAEAPEQPQA